MLPGSETAESPALELRKDDAETALLSLDTAREDGADDGSAGWPEESGRSTPALLTRRDMPARLLPREEASPAASHASPASLLIMPREAGWHASV